MGAPGEAMIKLNRLFFPLVVGIPIACLVMLHSSSFRQSGVVTMSSDFWRKYDVERCAGGGAIRDVMRLLHSSVERVLVNGSLPLDPSDNSSTSIFKKNSPEHNCSQYKTRFGIGLRPVWLVSFPRSGNTWTRYLLEAASGVFTGSVYTDRILSNTGYLGERDRANSRRTIVQKTHSDQRRNLNENDSPSMRILVNNTSLPTVLLLRNPANAVISYYKFIQNRPHPSQIPASKFETKGFRTFVMNGVMRWGGLATTRLLETEAPLYVMYYERLVEDPIKEITGLLAFLGIPRHEERLACLSLQLEGTFKSEKSEPRDPYTFEEKVMMAAQVRKVNITLQLLGYPPLPSYPDLLK